MSLLFISSVKKNEKFEKSDEGLKSDEGVFIETEQKLMVARRMGSSH